MFSLKNGFILGWNHRTIDGEPSSSRGSIFSNWWGDEEQWRTSNWNLQSVERKINCYADISILHLSIAGSRTNHEEFSTVKFLSLRHLEPQGVTRNSKTFYGTWNNNSLQRIYVMLIRCQLLLRILWMMQNCGGVQ